MSDLTTMITLNGKQSQKTIENHHLFYGYINYFDEAMASSSKLLVFAVSGAGEAKRHDVCR